MLFVARLQCPVGGEDHPLGGEHRILQRLHRALLAAQCHDGRRHRGQRQARARADPGTEPRLPAALLLLAQVRHLRGCDVQQRPDDLQQFVVQPRASPWHDRARAAGPAQVDEFDVRKARRQAAGQLAAEVAGGAHDDDVPALRRA